MLHSENQLILLSAGTSERRAANAARAQELVHDIDFTQLTDTLRRRRLLGTLGPKIVDLAGEVDHSFRTDVDNAVTIGRRHGAILQLACAHTVAQLTSAGVRSASLKGPTLGERIYGDLGRRSSGDIDLLVPAEQLHAAVDVVRELGYNAPIDNVERSGLPSLHFALAHKRHALPPIELHWRVHWYEERFSRERLLPNDIRDCGDWRPAVADELVSLLLFYARDGFVGLRLAGDLSAWWDVYGPEVTPGVVDETLRAFPALKRVVTVAASAARLTVGLPSESFLTEPRHLGNRGRLARRLANPNPQSSTSQLYADMGLIDGLLAPSGGAVAFVRRQMLPPKEVLDQQAEHGAKRRVQKRSRTRIGRFGAMLARYGLTITRLLRPPETLR